MKLVFAFSAILIASISTQIHAQDYSTRGNAQWLLERITGIKWPADNPLINQMEQRIAAGDKAGAVDLALAQPQFLNVTVKQFALKMSTREESLTVPLNDFTAAFMGVTRDNMDSRELLTGNFYYRADPAKITLTAADLGEDIIRSNKHYIELGKRPNTNVASVLQKVDRQMLVGAAASLVPNPEPAGVLTSRAFLGSHSIAGTNRRIIEYTFREFLCVKMAEWSDTGAPDLRVARDISRAPGGDPNRYQSSCKGCHTQMDSMRGAFGRFDFQGSSDSGYNAYLGVTTSINTEVDPGNVPRKMNRPTFIEYSGGYVTKDDTWINNARGPANALRFGWTGPSVAGGTGANSFGKLIAGSARFPSCMAKRVWASVCKYELPSDDAETLYVSLGLAFASGGYKLKDLFKVVAQHPKCRQ